MKVFTSLLDLTRDTSLGQFTRGTSCIVLEIKLSLSSCTLIPCREESIVSALYSSICHVCIIFGLFILIGPIYTARSALFACDLRGITISNSAYKTK